MKVVPSACCHDCGGTCPLNIHVEDDRIVKIEAHDIGTPTMRPCPRGLLYHYRVYAPDRLQYPMKRCADRGEGKFTRISWDEALDIIARQITRIRACCTNPSLQMILGGKIEASGEGGRDGVQLD